MHPSTDESRLEQVVDTIREQITHITRTLGHWVQEDTHELQQIEQHVLRLVKELGSSLVAGLCGLLTPLQPTPTVPCPCGKTARYQRQRPATVTTLLGPITFERPYYLCAACGHGHHPLDAHLQLRAGSRSAGLDELFALLGATQDSFAEAASVLERLSLVQVSPNSVRDATEQLGADLVAHQAQAVARAMDGQDDAPAVTPSPTRLYLTMDGVLAHLHERGWSELKVGCCYQTRARPARRRPEQLEIHAQNTTDITALTDAQTFGWHLWQEAVRRGVAAADEVVVVGDGAHWIWNIAELHFPAATQVLDWYHASSYVWHAASTIWGESHPQREPWAHQQLDRLWESKVEQVLAELEQQRAAGEGVTEALSYFTTHQARMDYAAYRARGLQIGSGTVESGCKQVVSARLKQAGMIWEAAGAEQVATVRAWLKSERWQEAMGLRSAAGRSYQRHRSQSAATGSMPTRHAEPGAAAEPESRDARMPTAGGLPPEVLATIRAELRDGAGRHPWYTAWSVKRQREQHAEHMEQAGTARTA